MQSKLQSLVEAISNVAVGFGIALTTQILIFPLFDIHISFAKNFGITVVFTIVSVVRSYVVRRFFNRRHHEQNQKT